MTVLGFVLLTPLSNFNLTNCIRGTNQQEGEEILGKLTSSI